MQTENQANEQQPKQKGKCYTPKTKLPAPFKLESFEAAQGIINKILTEQGKSQREAIATLITLVADPNGHAEKFKLAERLLKTLYVETESFKSSFQQYLLKTRSK